MSGMGLRGFGSKRYALFDFSINFAPSLEYDHDCACDGIFRLVVERPDARGKGGSLRGGRDETLSKDRLSGVNSVE